MTREELKRLPFVSGALATIHPHNSTCGVCGLPWCECKPECIETNEREGVFYVCEYCFRHSSLEEVLRATVHGYMGQYISISEYSNRDVFVNEHDLVGVLMKTQERYLEIHKNEDYDKRTD